MRALITHLMLVAALAEGLTLRAQTNLIYEAVPLDSNTSVANLDSGDEVADWVELATSTSRQLAQIDFTLFVQPFNPPASGTIRATLYKSTGGSGPGMEIATSNPIDFIGKTAITSPDDLRLSISVTAADFPIPSIILDDNLYVGIKFDAINRPFSALPVSILLADQTMAGVTTGSNYAENYYVNKAGAGFLEQNTGTGNNALAISILAVNAIPEPATMGLMLTGLVGLLGLRHLRPSSRG